MAKNNKRDVIINILNDCGGKIIGRVRLQKLTYLATCIDNDVVFDFDYYHYGPYSDDLTEEIDDAIIDDIINEEVIRKQNGLGKYSIFKLKKSDDPTKNDDRQKFLQKAKEIDALYMELLATALFLHNEKPNQNPWKRLKELKPNKAQDEHLKASYNAYDELRKLSENLQGITTPLPQLLPPLGG